MNSLLWFGIQRKSLLFLILTLSIIGLTNCQSPKYYPEPEKYLIKELGSRKILVLGDFDHAAAYPYKKLMDLLNEWRDQIGRGDSKDKDLTLVLEGDDETINIIKSFISTGKVNDVINYWAPYNSLETIEFYYDLRAFVESVDALNMKRDSSEKISLNIVGAELFNTFNNPLYGKPKEEMGHFIITGRDSVIARRIIDNLDKSPKRKAIVFYGSAHLTSVRQDKRWLSGDLTCNTLGYYFPYHLKVNYDPKDILTVLPSIFENGEQLKNLPLGEVKEKAFFAYSKTIRPDDTSCDGHWFINEPLTPKHMLDNIFSENILKGCLQKMKMFKPKLPNVYLKSFYDRALESLKFLTGQKFTEISDWEKWIAKNKFNGFERLNSPEFKQMIEEKYFAEGKASDRSKMLSIGIKNEILNRPVAREEWEQNWDKTLAGIKLVNAIGVNCIGTPEEQEKAKQYLISVTGKDFLNPVDYVKYYRQTVFHVSY